MTANGERKPTQLVINKETMKANSGSVVRIDSNGRVLLNPEHEQTLRHIVKAIGKNKWEDATQLLLTVYESEIDFNAEDVEIYKRVAGYYRLVHLYWLNCIAVVNYYFFPLKPKNDYLSILLSKQELL